MAQRGRFTADEWRTLQFAVLDVFNMVANIEGPTGADEREKRAFVELLRDPTQLRDPLLREVVGSMAESFSEVATAYRPQYRLDTTYFEASFRRAGALLSERLGVTEAIETKTALAVVLGGHFANASDDARQGRDHISEQEVRAITVITHWLGAREER